MDIPKPGSWIKKPSKKPKMPYVLKPHLTSRPLEHDPFLEELLDIEEALPNKKGLNK